jgi:hypothetical protein
MGLGQDDQNKLNDALIAAFRNRDELERMVGLRMDEELDLIDDSTISFQQSVFELVKWARKEGRVEELAKAASEFKPRNRDLRLLAAKLNQSPFNLPAILRLITALNDLDLRLFCSAYYPEVFDESVGKNQDERALLLFNHVRTNGLFEELLNGIKEYKPRVYAEFEQRIMVSTGVASASRAVPSIPSLSSSSIEGRPLVIIVGSMSEQQLQLVSQAPELPESVKSALQGVKPDEVDKQAAVQILRK